jgi:hypothetical protein
MEVRSLKRQHASELKNLISRQENELERNKMEFERQRFQVEQGHKATLNSVRDQNREQLIRETKKREEVLNEMKEQLETTKKRMAKERLELEKRHESELQRKDRIFKNELEIQNMKNEISLQDLNQTANLKAQELQRKIRTQETAVNREHNKEVRNMESLQKDKVHMNKSQFYKEYMQLDSQHQRALFKKKVDSQKMLAREEKKLQNELEKRRNKSEEILNRLEVETNRKIAQQENHFTQKYNGIQLKNEDVFQRLLKNKEKIIHDFTQDVYKSHDLTKAKAKDDFYTFSKIEPRIEKSSEGYTIRVKTPEHDARYLNMTADGRELKFQYNRDFSLVKENEETGAEHKMSKHESYSSRLPVDKIVDSMSVVKTYEDGDVVFKVKYA